MTDHKPYRHRFSITILQHSVWLYHHFPLKRRDGQELLHERGIKVGHDTLRELTSTWVTTGTYTKCV